MAMDKMATLLSVGPENTPLLKQKHKDLAPLKMPGAHDKNPDGMSLGERLAQLNGMLIFLMVYLAFCALNFGYDVGTFGGVQAMRSFAKEFGEWDEQRETYALPAWLSSVMTATPFLGKAFGCLISGMLAERWGRKPAIGCMCIVSIVGAVLQTCATTTTQFTIGRVLTYVMTGFVIVVVPLFIAEISPRALRGMFASMIQLMIVLGQMAAALIVYGTQRVDGPGAWKIPIGLQIVFPCTVAALMPIVPESPRWLLLNDRVEDAMRNLQRLRPRASEQDIRFEVAAIRHAHVQEAQGTWEEVFDVKNRVRTGVAVLVMFGQQITGQAFPSQYGVVFYQSQGFGSQAFLFSVATSLLGLGAVLIPWLFVDGVGRRPVLLAGGFCMGISLFLLGVPDTISRTELDWHLKSMTVASVFLFTFFFNLSWASISYIVVSETAALRVKEKTNLLACIVSVLTTFVTSFTCPYLINERYANLGGRVGFIYGSLSMVMVVLTYFFIPELKGRTLEEIDQLFASGVALRKFHTVNTRTAEELYEDDVLAGRRREDGVRKADD